MRLETESSTSRDVRSEAEVRQSLAGLGHNQDTFAILSISDHHYVQVALKSQRFVVERREGSFDRHFEAHVGQRRYLTREEVAELFIAYFSGTSMPREVHWTSLGMSQSGLLRVGAHGALRYTLAGLPFALFAIFLAWKWLPR